MPEKLTHPRAFIFPLMRFYSKFGFQKRASRILSLEIKPPFNQRPDDNTTFKHLHPAVKTCQVPRLWQLSHKDSLGATYALYAAKFPDDYDFHPQTFTLPQDKAKLIKKMKSLQEVKNQSSSFWYARVVPLSFQPTKCFNGQVA